MTAMCVLKCFEAKDVFFEITDGFMSSKHILGQFRVTPPRQHAFGQKLVSDVELAKQIRIKFCMEKLF